MISNTPTPPYYAVIFSSVRTADNEGYAETDALMNELALQQDGFLGMPVPRLESPSPIGAM